VRVHEKEREGAPCQVQPSPERKKRQVEPYPTKNPSVKPSVEGRCLLELRDGHLTLSPITQTDEETEELLNAILQHMVETICRERTK